MERQRQRNSDFTPYLKDVAKFSTSDAEDFIKSPFYPMFKLMLEDRLVILNQNLRSAPDFAEIRFILGQISVTEANLDLLETIYLWVYPLPEKEESDDGAN